MSKNRHIARHRATPPSTMQIVSKAVSTHAGTVGRPAAVVVAASGIMFGAALPASAGTTYSSTSGAVQSADAAVQVSAPAAAPAAPVNAQTVSAPAPAPVTNAPTHTVRSGDTLGAIAANYGVSLDAIFAANGLGWNSVIYPGQVISLSGSAAAAPAPAAPAPQVQVAPAPVAPAPAPAPAETSTMGITTASSNIEVASYSAAPASSSVAGTIAAAAQGQIGVIQDCTRLVSNALAAAGINFHDWPAGYLSLGSTVSAGQAMPGDLIYYADGGMGAAHIAVYIGNGQAVHGGFNGNQTVVAPAQLGSGPVFIRVNG
ncbi:LysM peptidoglycan-binding domain-containing protein [Arthrobacter tecti]